ncbi:DUF6877 family protein [Clostridium sp.]|uniref:DUF6877 family protein n=1 Tax=Clostridium sp. TaxID=1506 RepID=UPI0039955941
MNNLIQIENMDDLIIYSDRIPTVILQDVEKRIGDYLAMGGNYNDPYIKQQFRFINNYFKKYSIAK